MMLLQRASSLYMVRKAAAASSTTIFAGQHSVLPLTSVQAKQALQTFHRRHNNSTSTIGARHYEERYTIPPQLMHFSQSNQMQPKTTTTTEDEMQEIYNEWSLTYDDDMIGGTTTTASEFAPYVVPQRASEELDHQLRKSMVQVGKGYIDEEQNPLNDGHSNQKLQIVDVGAGTGFVGECLQMISQGNYDVIAIDLNKNMLEKAKLKKNIYKEHYCMDISSEVDLAQLKSKMNTTNNGGGTFGFFDAVICVESIFPNNHIYQSSAIDHMIQLIRNPGGILCFTTRCDGTSTNNTNGGEDIINNKNRPSGNGLNEFSQHITMLEETGKIKLLNVTEPEPISWGVPDYAYFQTWTYMVVS